MQKRVTFLCGVSALSGLFALALVPQARASSHGIEKELLGIRLLQSYRDVLSKYGQPTRVYRNDEVVGLIQAFDNQGQPSGGILGFTDGPAATTAATPGPSPAMGGPIMGGPPSGMMSRLPRMAGGGGGGGAEGKGAMMGGPMGAPMGAPTGGGAAASAPRVGSYSGGETFEESGGFKWVYFYPNKQLIYEFMFNRDGRIEIILERGHFLGQPTSRGIALGKTIRDLYATYGWPDSIDDEGLAMSFNYNQKNHVEFTVMNKKVTGIAVLLREDQRTFLRGGSNLASNGGGGGGRVIGMGAPGGGRRLPSMAGGAPPPAAGGGGGGNGAGIE